MLGSEIDFMKQRISVQELRRELLVKIPSLKCWDMDVIELGIKSWTGSSCLCIYSVVSLMLVKAPKVNLGDVQVRILSTAQ